MLKPYCFENFIVTCCNEEAYEACLSFSEAGAGSFLALCGPSHCGKTHLLGAIRKRIVEKAPKKTVLAVSYEELVNGLVEAMMNKTVNQYRKMICACDVLIVDHFQFAVGKENTQKVFSDWFSDMLNQGKCVAVAFDISPFGLRTFLEGVIQNHGDKRRIVEMKEGDAPLRKRYLERVLKETGFSMSKKMMEKMITDRTVPFSAIGGIVMKLSLYQKQSGSSFSELEAEKILNSFQR